MVTAELSTLLLDWSTAVIELKLEKVHALLEKEPELLWTPIPHSLDEPDHLMARLQDLLKLGTSFLPVSAIQYCLIHYKDLPDMSEQTKRYRLLAYLIEQSSVHDLDTRFWGECNNSTLHLVCFLGHLNVLKLLVSKGVSITPTNELGYTPRDIASDENMLDYLRSLPKKNQVSRTKSVRPNYSTPDRFKLLRELAEESSVVSDEKKKTMIGLDRQKSDGRFFRKGHVKETQKKVLTEDEEELEKQRAKRQQEMTQLVKQSAVKNNPLYRKLEKRTYTAPVLGSSSLVSDSPFNEMMVEEPESSSPTVEKMKRKASKRNSQVINSLQKKSYVSTSIFLQDTTTEKTKVVPPLPSSPSEDSEMRATMEKQIHDNIHMTGLDIPKHAEEVEKSPEEYTIESLDIPYNPIPLQKGTEATSDRMMDEDEYLSEHGHDSELSDDDDEEEDIREAYFVDQDHISVVAAAVAETVEEEHAEESSDDADFLSIESENESETSEDEDIKYTTAEIKRMSRNLLSSATMPTMEQREDQVGEEEEEEEEEQYVDSGTEEILHTAAEIKRFSQNFVPKLDIEEEEDDTEDEETYEKLYNYEMYPDDDEYDEDPVSPEEPDVRASIIDDDSSSEEELEEGTASAVHLATRMVTPVYKSVMMKSEENLKEENDNTSNEQQPEVLTRLPPRRFDSSLSIDTLKSRTSVSSTATVPTAQKSTMAPEMLEQQPQPQPQPSRYSSLPEQPYQQEQPPSRQEQPSRPDRSDLRKSQQVRKGSRDSKRMSGSQKASWTMSMSSWAAILDREFSLEELDPNNKRLTIKESLEKKASVDQREEDDTERKSMSPVEEKIEITDEDMHLMLHQGLARTSFDKSTLSLAPTLEIKGATRLSQMYPPQNTLSNNTSRDNNNTKPAPQLEEIPRLQSSKSIRRKPIDSMVATSSLNLPKRATLLSEKKFNTMPTISHTARHDQGKLYLHVNGVQDILLPLPKERAYVRCVVSDGRFEYMSRYEILSQNINFNYECVIDTHRDMIITISLHVRPDYVMKSRTPFSRFFSSKKKKETLSGYVNKEDGAIGQARFALAHMVPVCQESSYLAGFHCFNAWYSKSFKERHRQKKKDPNYEVLKVVGNFDVEMLYLPVTDYQQVFPRNLRECEKALHRTE